MAAQAKFPNLKPADISHDSPASAPNILRPEFDAHRRRLSVSEKLAEGRGFWRGTFAGATIGVVGGIAGSLGMINVLVPPLQAAMQQALVATFAVGAPAPAQANLAARTAEEGASLTIHTPGGQNIGQP